METPAVQIRPYLEDDEDGVVTLWNRVFPNPTAWNEPRFTIAKKLATQRDLFFVAVLDGTVVGTAMGGFDGHRGWLYTVAVFRTSNGGRLEARSFAAWRWR
jgi:hypothetical protein